MESRHEYEVAKKRRRRKNTSWIRLLQDSEDLRNSDWDDSKMIAAYDKSVRAREKAIAKAKKQGKNQESDTEKNNIKDKLHVGMHCRALYPADGCYYEAKLRKVERNCCTVEFLGYGDLEEVDPQTLRESLGKKARKNQIRLAKDENSVMSLTCGESSDAASGVHESCVNKKKLQDSQVANQMPSYDYPAAAENCNAYQMPHQAAPYFAPPQVPQNMPFMPPVPPMPQCSGIANNPSMSNLLISWYMAGYYTGLYQTQKGGSCSQRCCGHSNQCCHH